VKGVIAWIGQQNSKGNYIDKFDEYGRSLLHIAMNEDAGEKAHRPTVLHDL